MPIWQSSDVFFFLGCSLVLGGGGKRDSRTYAALFCAFRRDCAGVRFSFSSLLLRVLPTDASIDSPPNPLSMLPITSGGELAAGGEPAKSV